MEKALRNRLTFGSIMLAALLGLLYLDWWIEQATRGWHFGSTTTQTSGLAGVGLFIALIVAAQPATQELAGLLTAENVRPYRFLAVMGSSLLALHAFLTQFVWFQPIAASTLAFIIVFIMLLAALRRALAQQTQQAITRMAGTLLAMLYFGGLGWFLIALRVKHSMNQVHGFQGSTQAVVMMLLVVKFTDIGAYFGGRTFGKHKLILWLSPGKTWEGLFFGLVTSALVGWTCWMIWPHALSNLNAVKAIIFGILIGGVGQIGDLLESLMKRDAEVKDSGNSIPGFGGVLDVIDSPLFAAPFAYLLFSLF